MGHQGCFWFKECWSFLKRSAPSSVPDGSEEDRRLTVPDRTIQQVSNERKDSASERADLDAMMSPEEIISSSSRVPPASIEGTTLPSQETTLRSLSRQLHGHSGEDTPELRPTTLITTDDEGFRSKIMNLLSGVLKLVSYRMTSESHLDRKKKKYTESSTKRDVKEKQTQKTHRTASSRRPLPKGARLHPVGIYRHVGFENKHLAQTIDLKLIRKWIRDQRRLAPFFEGTMTLSEKESTCTPTTTTTMTLGSDSKHDITIDPRRDDLFIECPICLLFYPRDCINRSRCCRQPICTECFLYVSAAKHFLSKTSSSSTPQDTFSGDIVYLNGRRYRRRRRTSLEQRSLHQLITCPFCMTPHYGVVYLPDYRSDGSDDDDDHENDEANNKKTASSSSLTKWNSIETNVVTCSIQPFTLEELPFSRLSQFAEQAYYTTLTRQSRREARQSVPAESMNFEDQMDVITKLLRDHELHEMVPPDSLERLRSFVEQRRSTNETMSPAARRSLENLWNLAEELLLLHTLRISEQQQQQQHDTNSSPNQDDTPTSLTITPSIPSSTMNEELLHRHQQQPLLERDLP